MSLNSTLTLTSSFELAGPLTIQDTTQTLETSGDLTTTTISAQIDGAGLFRKAGTGTLILTNFANGYSGGTAIVEGTLSVGANAYLGAVAAGLTLDGGTLRVGDGFTTARATTLGTAGGTVEVDGAIATFTGVLSGAGALTKTGAGELVLQGTGNSYAGGTFINAGSLNVATDSLLGGLAGGLTFDGGTLNVAGGFTSARSVTLMERGGTLDTSGPSATFAGIISGPGGLVRAGSANTIILTGDNDYAGGTTIESGVLQIGNGGTTGSIIGDVANDGGLIFSRSDAYLVANNISGAGSVTIQGGGIATLTGSNTHTGETRVFGLVVPVGSPAQGSTLVATANDNLGSPTGTIVLDLGSTLTFADSFEVTRSIQSRRREPSTIDTQNNIVTASGVVSGLAPLVKDGIGTLILTNTNSQVGGAVINQGTLQIGGGAGTGTLNGNVSIAANARLVFDRANAASFGGISGRGGPTTFGGIISGEGEVVQTGNGTLTALGVHTYTGGTTVEGGRLLVNGSIAGPAQVADGARLGGTGSIGGTVTIADGGGLAPGASVGTLTVGSLLLNPGSQLDYELGLPDIVGGTTNDLIIVTGALTLDGTLNIADAGGFSRGVYRLINYGGGAHRQRPADRRRAVAVRPGRHADLDRDRRPGQSDRQHRRLRPPVLGRRQHRRQRRGRGRHRDLDQRRDQLDRGRRRRQRAVAGRLCRVPGHRRHGDAGRDYRVRGHAVPHHGLCDRGRRLRPGRRARHDHPRRSRR